MASSQISDSTIESQIPIPELHLQQQNHQEFVAEGEESSHQLPEIRPIRVPDRSESSSSSSSSARSARDFHSRSHSTIPRNQQGSPRSPFGGYGSGSNSSIFPSRFSDSHRFSSSDSSSVGSKIWSVLGFLGLLSNQKQQQQQFWVQREKIKRAWRVWRMRRIRGVLVLLALLGLFFLMNWWMILRLQDHRVGSKEGVLRGNSSSSRVQWNKFGKGKKHRSVIFSRMMALAAHALAEGEGKPEPKDLWEEPLTQASSWFPCADQRNWEPCEGKNGYILVSANGGINQQRVAVCNAVTLARLLNATLVIPKFLFNSVWRDVSQFGDIYQEEHFINYLKPDINIVKELPEELQSLDLEAISSIVTDADVMKEAKPSFYLKHFLPILKKNRVVHFVGFGNRLAFDPIPFQLQRLRCRCNFHALKFIPKIQETGALLLQRMHQDASRSGPLDPHLVGPYANVKGKPDHTTKTSRYLALHLRFEIDMVAHSLCEFGGGKEEKEELEAYRNIHFPVLSLLKNTSTLPSAAYLRSEGQCPLTPEEAVLMLAALGFRRKTHIYLAGAQIYGGESRLAALTSLYPNLVTKEKLLSPSEIEPFVNFSSQLAALDFIGCAAADMFAMTDSGSQLSSLVTGYRIYFGGGKMPSILPNKRRLASIFSKNATINWNVFVVRVRKAVRQNKQVHGRPVSRSVYRLPRCRECMCTTTTTTKPQSRISQGRMHSSNSSIPLNLIRTPNL